MPVGRMRDFREATEMGGNGRGDGSVRESCTRVGHAILATVLLNIRRVGVC